MFLNPAQGTMIDLPAADLQPDGKVYTTEQAPYDLVIVLGAAGEQLSIVTQKLQRLLNSRAGTYVAALTSPAPLQQAAELETWLQAQLGTTPHTSLQASRHDDLRRPLPNTVIGIEWQHATLPLEIPA